MPRNERRQFGRLRKLPSGRWQAAYTGPDSQVYKAPHTFAAKIDAEGWLTDRRREIDRELWSPPATTDQVKAKRDAERTFTDYAERWLATRTVKGRALRERTRDHYRSLLDAHLLPAFGTRPLRQITIEDVDSWYAVTLTDAPTMRAHAYGLLRTILTTACDRDRLIDRNPCQIRGAGSTERKVKPNPATLDELRIITDNMPDNLKLMIHLATWCALRIGELTELRRMDVDVSRGVIAVQRAVARTRNGFVVGDPKSAAGLRDVAIPPHVLPLVVDHLAAHVDAGQRALLFPSKADIQLQPSTIYRHFYRGRVAAGRPDLRFHELRHTGATLAAQVGATQAELMARLGHSTPQAAMRYQHAARGRDRVIADRLSELAGEGPLSGC